MSLGVAWLRCTAIGCDLQRKLDGANLQGYKGRHIHRQAELLPHLRHIGRDVEFRCWALVVQAGEIDGNLDDAWA